jgi:hypothetical protein
VLICHPGGVCPVCESSTRTPSSLPPSAANGATRTSVQATEGGLPPGRCIRIASAPRGGDRAGTREVALLLLGLAGLLPEGSARVEAQRLLAERRLAARAAWRTGHAAAVLEAAAGAGAVSGRGLQPGGDPPVQATRLDALWWLGYPEPLHDADAAEGRARAAGVLPAAPPSAGARPAGELRRLLQSELAAAGVDARYQAWWFERMGLMVRAAPGGGALLSFGSRRLCSPGRAHFAREATAALRHARALRLTTRAAKASSAGLVNAAAAVVVDFLAARGLAEPGLRVGACGVGGGGGPGDGGAEHAAGGEGGGVQAGLNSGPALGFCQITLTVRPARGTVPPCPSNTVCCLRARARGLPSGWQGALRNRPIGRTPLPVATAGGGQAGAPERGHLHIRQRCAVRARFGRRGPGRGAAVL